MAYWYAKYQSYFLRLEFSRISLMILASVLLGHSLLLWIEEAYPHVVWTTMIMLWNVFIDSDDLAIDPSSSTLMNATFLSWFINVVTRNLRMSRGGRLLLDGNPNGYEVAYHISTKVDVNPQMLSTLKSAKSIWSMNPGAHLDTSVVGPLEILVALVRRQIGQGSSNSGRFSGRPSISNFLAIRFSLVIETWPELWLISWERVCFEIPQKVGMTRFLSLWVFILKFSSWR